MINPLNDIDYIKTNRQKVQTTKKELFWCGCCDHDLISEWGKCGFCGAKNYKSKKRLKVS